MLVLLLAFLGLREEDPDLTLHRQCSVPLRPAHWPALHELRSLVNRTTQTLPSSLSIPSVIYQTTDAHNVPYDRLLSTHTAGYAHVIFSGQGEKALMRAFGSHSLARQ
mgnify:CR=1 FL=1